MRKEKYKEIKVHEIEFDPSMLHRNHAIGLFSFPRYFHPFENHDER
jgi:hypothetical protein